MLVKGATRVPESSSQNDYFPWDEYIFVKVFRTFHGICCAKVLLWIRTAYRYLSRCMSHRRLWIKYIDVLDIRLLKTWQVSSGCHCRFCKNNSLPFSYSQQMCALPVPIIFNRTIWSVTKVNVYFCNIKRGYFQIIGFSDDIKHDCYTITIHLRYIRHTKI